MFYVLDSVTSGLEILLYAKGKVVQSIPKCLYKIRTNFERPLQGDTKMTPWIDKHLS